MKVIGIRLWSLLLVAAPLVASAEDILAEAVGSPAQLHYRLTDPTLYQVSGYDQAIAKYRQLSDQPWPKIPYSKLKRAGDRADFMPLIRQRLRLLGDLYLETTAVDQYLLSPDLVAGLIRFQQRHGLKADGILGPETRRELNRTPQYRIQQLEVNRYRQQNFQLRVSDQTEYLQVNIPEFRLKYFLGGQLRTEIRTIVGRRTRPTPLLKSQLETIKVSPDWNVPIGIARKDIIPKLDGGADVLAEKGLFLVQGYGHNRQLLNFAELDPERLYVGSSPQRFWQPPGDENPLGRLKFNFPNSYAVYMHGTPSKKLFAETRRDFSSGCIRLEYPERLAWLMLASSEWGAKKLAFRLAGQKTREYRMPRVIPVHTTYWTAWVDAAGVVQFRYDLYRRDMRDYASMRIEQQKLLALRASEESRD